MSQRGVTLIELMVSLAIGLFIVLVATTIYVQGLSTVSFRAGQGENLSNSRYALGVLDNEFSKAGYRRDPSQKMPQAFPMSNNPYLNGCLFNAGQAIYAPTASSLCIRYQARDADETDCTGEPVNGPLLQRYEAPPAVPPDYWVFIERYAVVGGKLICQSGATGKSVDVADGVSDVRFEFGVDTGDDPSLGRNVYKYVTTSVNDPTIFIRALRYSVLLASTSKKVTQGMTSTVCSRWVESGGSANSCDVSGGQLYQLAVGSLSLRNLMP